MVESHYDMRVAASGRLRLTELKKRSDSFRVTERHLETEIPFNHRDSYHKENNQDWSRAGDTAQSSRMHTALAEDQSLAHSAHAG